MISDVTWRATAVEAILARYHHQLHEATRETISARVARSIAGIFAGA